MIPPRFDYERVGTVTEALDALEADSDVELLAGGHSLVPDMKNADASPGRVVDIGGIDALEGIDHGDEETAIGALTTYADLLADDELASRVPVLQQATAVLADRQIRNRGTIGGNLAYADPGADLPAAVLAADAVLEIEGHDGTREVPAGEFFVGRKETAVEDDELLARIRVPRNEAAGTAYEKKTHPATGYALVGVAAVVETAGGTVTEPRIAANGAFDYARRLEAVETALVGSTGDEAAIEDAAAMAGDGVDEDDFRSDPHASGEFRAHLLSVYAERALSRALA